MVPAPRPRSSCFSPQGPRHPPWSSSAPRGERGRRLLPRFLSGSSYLVNFWRHGFLAAGRGMLPCRVWGRPPACLLTSNNPVQPPPPDTSPASSLPFLCFFCEQTLCVATASALPCQQPVRRVRLVALHDGAVRFLRALCHCRAALIILPKISVFLQFSHGICYSSHSLWHLVSAMSLHIRLGDPLIVIERFFRFFVWFSCNRLFCVKNHCFSCFLVVM